MPEFPCPEPVTALVRIGGGVVDVTAEQRDTAVVDVTPYDGTNASAEAAANTRIELVDGRLAVEAPDSGAGWLFRRSSRLRVQMRIPLDCTLQIKVASADVSCHGRYVSVAVNTASGDVYVESVTGDVSANSASGDLRVVYVGGQLRLNSASGDLTAQTVNGEVTAHAASGDVEIEQAGAGVNATTASGDIRIGAASRGAIRANTVSGDVSVGVIAGTGVWLDLTTMSGSTRSDLAMEDTTPAATQDLSLQVRTVSGDIDVHRVPAITPRQSSTPVL